MQPAGSVEWRQDWLPRRWVQSILSRLSVRYGSGFTARYAGIKEDLLEADWGEQLAGFRNRPDLIAYAIDHLPADRAPTVGVFRELANSRPAEREPAAALLDYKRGPIPAAVMQALDRLKEPKDVDAQYAGPKGWAYRLRDRDAAGDRLSQIQRRLWREALHSEVA